MSAVDLAPDGDAAERRRLLLRCCGSQRWVAAMAAAAPWPDTDALLRAADEALDELDPYDWREALMAEDGVAAAPEDPVADDPGTRAAADTALRLYAQRFDFPFISARQHMPPDELLMRARIRLGNDEEAEIDNATAELRRLARQRLLDLLERNGARPA